MNILAALFLISILSGQLIRIPVAYGITVYPHDAILFCYLFFWLALRFKKKTFTFGALRRPLFLFFVTLLASFIVNAAGHSIQELISGISYTVRLALYAGLYFVIINTKREIFWIRSLYMTGVAFGVLGILQYILYPNLRNLSYLGWDPHYFRLFSTFLDPNFSGIFLVLTFLLGLTFFIQKKIRLEYIILQSIVLTALTLTLSRGSYIAFVAGLVLYAYWEKIRILLVGIAVCIAVFIFIPLPNKDVTPIFRKDSTVARMENWSYSMNLIGKAPIFGYGFNFLRSIQEPDSVQAGSSGGSHASAGVDNSFLFVLSTAGITGGIAWIYLLTSMWSMGKRRMRTEKGRALGTVYCLSLASVLIHSMFVNSFFYPWVFIWLWILTGTIEKSDRARN